MSRLGTCRHAYQIQEQWVIDVGPDYSHPHSPKKTERHEVMPEEYTCQWLEQHEPLPPPIKRRHGGIDLREGDCEQCPHYEPAASLAAFTK